MLRVKNTRIWWLGLVVIAAMLIAIPTALAQGPVEPAGTSAPSWVPGGESRYADADDGYYRLEFGIEAPNSGFSWHPELPTARDLRTQLLAGGWGGGSSFKWEWSDAWEQDWKRYDQGGTNNSNADAVDFAFYVGHGGPGSFTFNGNVDDNWATYQNAYGAWGDHDLEWVGLLSCAVLDNSHVNDWAWTMNGLHLLMGFRTNASAAYPGFGNTLGWRLRLNDTVAGAWMYACDTQQGTSNQARILAEDPAYWNERPYYRYGDTWDNWYQIWDHWCGSEYPRAAAPLAGNAMPVFQTPPLSLAEATAEWGSLTNAFGLPTQGSGILATGPMSGTESGGKELTMDPVSGQFYYIDHNTLFTVTNAIKSPQAVNITPGQAQAIATFFLTSTGLMPADAQFFEVATNGISDAMVPGRAMGVMGGPAELGPMATTDYSVIYSRILTYTVMGANGVQAVEEYSVGGPGAKMKVYVNPAGAAASGASMAVAAATDVVGAQGGWRRVDNEPAPGIQATAALTETILDYPVIVELFNQLEKQVALAATALPNPTSRTILSSTVFYWEEATGTGQAQLFPAYDLVVEYAGLDAGEPVTIIDHSYIPAAPEYMRPYAEIVSSNVGVGSFQTGQVLQASAADASLQLSQLGHAGLNFVLGSGSVNYIWYLTSPEGLVQIGTGQNLNWTIDLSKLNLGKAVPASQSLVLEVTDLLSPHSSQKTSQDSLQFNVVPPVFLPLVVRF